MGGLGQSWHLLHSPATILALLPNFFACPLALLATAQPVHRLKHLAPFLANLAPILPVFIS